MVFKFLIRGISFCLISQIRVIFSCPINQSASLVDYEVYAFNALTAAIRAAFVLQDRLRLPIP